MSAHTVIASLAEGSVAESFVRGAYLPSLILHTGGGIVGMLSGAAALLFPKGELLHRMAGRVFAVAMLVLGLSAVLVAETRVSVVTGPFAAYFVATAWMTAQRESKGAGLLQIVAFLGGSGFAATYFIFGALAVAGPTGRFDGFPAAFHYFFGTIAALGAILDLKVILMRGVSGAARIARHLWRMCLALCFAATSFFFGQIDRFPEFVRESGFNFAVALLPMAFLIFWLVRVRLMKRYAVPAFAAWPARIAGALYLTAVAAGLFALLLPRNV